jgi:tetratricopeptide (TPR) repeat protein
MNFPLANPRARAAIVGGSSLLALALGFFGIRNALAAHFRGLDIRGGYERAVRFEPSESRNWYLLGRSYLYDLEQPDPVRAIAALEKAVSLDPYSAEALLDLANAYEGEGDQVKARTAFAAAEKVYPLSAEAVWRYGNFLLRQGERDRAFERIRKAVELDPKRAAEAFSRAIRFEPDANLVLNRALPPSAATYLPILHGLSDAGDLETAQLVWDRLVALETKVPLGEVTYFFDALTHAKRPADAARLWPQAIAIMENPPPPDPQGSLLWDGGFESGISRGGFSWHFAPVSRDVQISFDRAQKRTGQQSLRILFNGHENINFEDACHNFVPEFGETYDLSGWVRTQSLTSSEGVRLSIFAYSSTGNVTAQTGEVHGTQPWTELRLRWTAPADSGFGRVCVRRNMSDMPGSDIQGAAWIDDVAFTPAHEGGAKP